MPLSVKTKEHFRRRMALAGPKWGALMGGAGALAGGGMCSAPVVAA